MIDDVISTLAVQLAPAATVKYPSLILRVPGVTTTPEYPLLSIIVQLVVVFGWLEITTPLGSTASRCSAAISEPFDVLSNMYVSLLTAPGDIELGETAIDKFGLALSTVRLADAEPELPPELVKSPVVLTCVPGVVLVTSTEISHVLPIGRRSSA